MPETPRCAVCHRKASADFRPFCSKRCADIDLGRWFTESYRIPATAPDPRAGEDDNLMD